MGTPIQFPLEKPLKPVNIGLLGLGTVGQGVAQILSRNAAEIERRAGRGILVKTASIRNQGQNLADELGITTTKDPQTIVTDPEIEIVCEMMGGEQPAFDLIMTAIDNGKHIITANKALIAIRGNEIFKAAREKGVIVAFEPAVAGGIPIIKAVREGLSANIISGLAGIINGTGNYILSSMASDGRAFDEVLAEAQALGYAEADPEFDVEGIDAAHKLTILASIAFGIPLQFDAVFTEGISNIKRKDVGYAAELGYRIKHLGIARRRQEGIELRVHPTLIPEKRLLANVDGVMNAVLVQSDAVGPTLYYGPGAGSEPTGSAVVADIVDIVRALTTDPQQRVPHLAFQFNSLLDQPVLKPADFESGYYLRLQAQDKPGVMADIMGIFGALGISIEAILQKEPPVQLEPASENTTVPIILLTRTVREGLVLEAIEKISVLSSITDDVTMIRVETLG
jgi:homoserine dehydrogenase